MSSKLKCTCGTCRTCKHRAYMKDYRSVTRPISTAVLKAAALRDEINTLFGPYTQSTLNPNLCFYNRTGYQVPTSHYREPKSYHRNYNIS